MGTNGNGHLTAAIYARLSKEKKGMAEDEGSIPLQKKLAQEYATAHGWRVDTSLIFEDTKSGAEFEARDGLQALLASLGTFDVLVVRDLDRLSREQQEGGYLLKRIAKSGVQIFEYKNGAVKMDSAMDRFMVSAKNNAGEIEREQASRRVRETFEAKVRQGHATGHAAFGYLNQRQGSHVIAVVHEPEAAVIRTIFKLAADGQTPRRIARALNEEHAPGPKGRAWRGSTIAQVIARDTYRGIRVWGRRKARDQYGAIAFKAASPEKVLTVEAAHLRIVDDLTWQRAHDALQGRSVPSGFSGYHGPAKHLLVGYATCGLCGAGLIVVNRKRAGGRERFYTCGGHHQKGPTGCTNATVFPMRAAEAAVLRAIQEAVLDPPTIDRILDAFTREQESVARSKKRLARETAQAEQEVARLVEAIATGTGAIPALSKRLQEAQTRLDALKAEKPRAGARPLISERVEEVRERFHRWRRMTGLFAGGTEIAPERAREVLAGLLVGRLAFTPAPGGVVTFAGQATLNNALKGVVQNCTQSPGMR